MATAKKREPRDNQTHPFSENATDERFIRRRGLSRALRTTRGRRVRPLRDFTHGKMTWARRRNVVGGLARVVPPRLETIRKWENASSPRAHRASSCLRIRTAVLPVFKGEDALSSPMTEIKRTVMWKHGFTRREPQRAADRFSRNSTPHRRRPA